MKAFISILLSMAFVSTSFADDAANSAKIKAAAEKISAIADTYGASSVIQVKPASPLKMLKEMSEEATGDFNWDPESAMEPDSSAWGFTTMAVASGWIESVEDAYTKEQVADYKKAVRSLIGTGVVFGVSPTGAAQCGIRFPALLLIDTKAGKIYEIALEGSGC
ncbi:MAG: hypothetical protein V4692_02635 [Bdellovibrionota bacterium]